ncbi:MAG: TetR/AcrR family transcriptional regulator C-terminal domain-containing protein [Eubacteriales bacterium]|nr:TetR/AcrR family transcriptional regulator C-terminal domain-containing protein [Eubacteriales bacterium]
MIYRKTTKETLAESLRELSESKSIDKITIREIVENCGMSAGTFYNHFKDKYDLIAWIYLNQMESITKEYLEQENGWLSSLTALLRVVNKDHIFYKNALKNTAGQNSFFEAASQRSIELMRDVIRERKGADLTKEEEFDILFYLKGFGYCIEAWIVQGLPYTEEELAGYLSRTIPVNISSYLGEKQGQ